MLINNAGIGVDRRIEIVDGFELNFAVNYLAPFVLSTELQPLLEASAPSRVVTVSSAMHASVKPLDPDDLQSANHFKWDKAYNRAKLASILFFNEFTRRLEGTGVTSNSLHPGAAATNFGGDGDLTEFTAVMLRIMRWFLPGPEAGAQTSIYLATAPGLEQVNGRHFEKLAQKAPSELAQDEELAKKLWQKSKQ